MSISVDDSTFTIEFLNSNNIKPKIIYVNAGEYIVTFYNIYNNIDIIYHLYNREIKEEIIIKNRDSADRIKCKFVLKNCKLKKDDNSNQFKIIDNNEYILFTIPDPFIQNKKYLNILDDKNYIDVYFDKENNIVEYSFNKNVKFFPIIIDPSFIFETSYKKYEETLCGLLDKNNMMFITGKSYGDIYLEKEMTYSEENVVSNNQYTTTNYKIPVGLIYAMSDDVLYEDNMRVVFPWVKNGLAEITASLDGEKYKYSGAISDASLLKTNFNITNMVCRGNWSRFVNYGIDDETEIYTLYLNQARSVGLVNYINQKGFNDLKLTVYDDEGVMVTGKGYYYNNTNKYIWFKVTAKNRVGTYNEISGESINIKISSIDTTTTTTNIYEKNQNGYLELQSEVVIDDANSHLYYHYVMYVYNLDVNQLGFIENTTMVNVSEIDSNGNIIGTKTLVYTGIKEITDSPNSFYIKLEYPNANGNIRDYSPSTLLYSNIRFYNTISNENETTLYEEKKVNNNYRWAVDDTYADYAVIYYFNDSLSFSTVSSFSGAKVEITGVSNSVYSTFGNQCEIISRGPNYIIIRPPVTFQYSENSTKYLDYIKRYGKQPKYLPIPIGENIGLKITFLSEDVELKLAFIDVPLPFKKSGTLDVLCNLDVTDVSGRNYNVSYNRVLSYLPKININLPENNVFYIDKDKNMDLNGLSYTMNNLFRPVNSVSVPFIFDIDKKSNDFVDGYSFYINSSLSNNGKFLVDFSDNESFKINPFHFESDFKNSTFIYNQNISPVPNVKFSPNITEDNYYYINDSIKILNYIQKKSLVSPFVYSYHDDFLFENLNDGYVYIDNINNTPNNFIVSKIDSYGVGNIVFTSNIELSGDSVIFRIARANHLLRLTTTDTIINETNNLSKFYRCISNKYIYVYKDTKTISSIDKIIGILHSYNYFRVCLIEDGNIVLYTNQITKNNAISLYNTLKTNFNNNFQVYNNSKRFVLADITKLPVSYNSNYVFGARGGCQSFGNEINIYLKSAINKRSNMQEHNNYSAKYTAISEGDYNYTYSYDDKQNKLTLNCLIKPSLFLSTFKNGDKFSSYVNNGYLKVDENIEKLPFDHTVMSFDLNYNLFEQELIGNMLNKYSFSDKGTSYSLNKVHNYKNISSDLYKDGYAVFSVDGILYTYRVVGNNKRKIYIYGANKDIILNSNIMSLYFSIPDKIYFTSADQNERFIRSLIKKEIRKIDGMLVYQEIIKNLENYDSNPVEYILTDSNRNIDIKKSIKLV
jgi:hypothetical protein